MSMLNSHKIRINSVNLEIPSTKLQANFNPIWQDHLIELIIDHQSKQIKNPFPLDFPTKTLRCKSLNYQHVLHQFHMLQFYHSLISSLPSCRPFWVYHNSLYYLINFISIHKSINQFLFFSFTSRPIFCISDKALLFPPHSLDLWTLPQLLSAFSFSSVARPQFQHLP